MKVITTTLLLAIIAAASTTVSASDDTAAAVTFVPAHRMLPADKPYKTYLKVGLTGCPFQPDAERPPVNVALVIDKSGSMGGEKIRQARKAALMALDRLDSGDTLSVVTYDSGVNVLLSAAKVTDKHRIRRLINSIEAGGRTALYDGVRAGGNQLTQCFNPDIPSRLILLSDGLANVGPSSPTELGSLGGKLAARGITVTTIGLGLGYNEDLMTRLAYQSDGSHYFARQPHQLKGIFEKELGQALSVVANNVHIEINCTPGVKPLQMLGRKGHINGQKATLDIGQLYSDHEKFLLLEVEVNPSHLKETKRLAVIKTAYRDLIGKIDRTADNDVKIAFTDSDKAVAENADSKILAQAVELIATRRNELALELRDKGKTDQAKQVLAQNEQYLRSNASHLNSDRLGEYALEQQSQKERMDSENWSETRKEMRESQFKTKQQQK